MSTSTASSKYSTDREHAGEGLWDFRAVGTRTGEVMTGQSAHLALMNSQDQHFHAALVIVTRSILWAQYVLSVRKGVERKNKVATAQTLKSIQFCRYSTRSWTKEQSRYSTNTKAGTILYVYFQLLISSAAVTSGRPRKQTSKKQNHAAGSASCH